MAGPAEAVATYIKAKDENRPWLTGRAFAGDARLEIVNETEAIAFPASSSGLAEITDVLVRQFNRDNENVYTFCLDGPPGANAPEYACDWLVGMTRRDTGQVRVGCGHYHWRFTATKPVRASCLTITLRVMQVLEPAKAQPVMGWLSGLAYPWCSAGAALAAMPDEAGLQPVAEFLGQRR